MKNEIIQGLQPLYERAKKEKLWFYCKYQDLWFTPDELMQYQSDGRFVWGAKNWELKDPVERLIQFNTLIENTTKRRDEWLLKMKDQK